MSHIKTTMAGLAATLCLLTPQPGNATGLFGDSSPRQHRVAVAEGPQGHAVWVQLRVDALAGQSAMVVPVRPGSTLDWSSRAWFEALEEATAPRVVPSEECVDQPVSAESLVDDPAPPLSPIETTVFSGSAEVLDWAAARGLSVSSVASAKLAAVESEHHFFVARFATTLGANTTPTLRIVSDDPKATLPFLLLEAKASPIDTTLWMLGAGKGGVMGVKEVSLLGSDVTFDLESSSSDYVSQRQHLLDALGGSALLLESASHERLVEPLALPPGPDLEPLVSAYFKRAAQYGDGESYADGCIYAASNALAAVEYLDAVCPRGDLGSIDAAPCVETVSADDLRCGPGADDLAVALSYQKPAAAWLTRYVGRLPSGEPAVASSVTFGGGIALSPVVEAGQLAGAWCQEPEAGTPISSGSGSDDDGGSYNYTTQGEVNCWGDTAVVYEPDESVDDDWDETWTDEEDVVYEDDTADVDLSDCGGDTSDSGDCSGDTGDSQGSDACSGDTTGDGSDACSGDTGDSYGDDCSGDTSAGDDCSGYSGDTAGGCSGDSGGSMDCDGFGDGCSGSAAPNETDEDTDGTIDEEAKQSTNEGNRSRRRRRHRARPPRMSKVVLSALMVVAPLRRLGRRRRNTKRRKRNRCARRRT